MNNDYHCSLLIFRRDLRVEDNTALLAALERSRTVIPCFIFTDQQTKQHPYRSLNGLRFMLESLRELAETIERRGGRLYLFHGHPHEVVRALASGGAIDAVFVNKDYTPYSRDRDRLLFETCGERGVPFHSFSDALLVEPSSFGKPDLTPYTVFTPFYKRALTLEVRRPIGQLRDGFGLLEEASLRGVLTPTSLERYEQMILADGGGAGTPRCRGGRRAGLGCLRRLTELSNYTNERDIPALDGTTLLSPHNKFGTVSIREAFWAAVDTFGRECSLVRELFWRDFFTHIAWHFPHVFKGAFRSQYDGVNWDEDEGRFHAWCDGMTGFPIVDAGIRELRSTGYMHNRVRMIVASFLVKDLHLSWRWGEAFFARHLTDYDPSVNNGSWQWAASTGCDAQPYFRIFNPWLQQKKFDPETTYIRRWIPELELLSAKQIHGLETDPLLRPKGYPKPMVDHQVAKQHAERMFRMIDDQPK